MQHIIKRINFGSVYVPMILTALMVAILLIVLTPARDSSVAVMYRNALITSLENPMTFQWPQGQYPDDFLQEVDMLPKPLQLAVPAAIKQNAWQSTLFVADNLLSGGRKGNPVMSDTLTTYQALTTTGEGYCSDYTKVMNSILSGLDISVREWGFSFKGYAGEGHAFNEIYDPLTDNWQMIDVFNAWYPIDATTRLPISVAAFHKALVEEINGELVSPQMVLKNIDIVFFEPALAGFKDKTSLIEYYRRGKDHFFVLWGHGAVRIDQHPMLKYFSNRPAIQQLLAIFVGEHPELRVYPTHYHYEDLKTLMKIKVFLIVAAVLEVILGLLLFAWIFMYRRLEKGAINLKKGKPRRG